MPHINIFWLIASHLAVAALGFAAGIFALPILTAPAGPTAAQLGAQAAQAQFTGHFTRDVAGSDWLHWGQGAVSVSGTAVALAGKLAPGPDYKLYLSPEFAPTRADVLRLKSRMVLLGDVNTFDGFVVPVPAGVDVGQFNTVVVWCESFEQFITAAQYR